MSILKQNIYANVTGKLWIAALGLAFTPIYLRLLGAEAFGLISFFTTLMATSQILEFGLGTTISRELARHFASNTGAQETRDLSRTFEVIYFAVAVGLGVVVFLASPFLTTKWLRIQSLPLSEAKSAVAEMGIALTLLWPCSFYSNALIGIERQAVLNGITAGLTTVRSVGAVFSLLLLGRNIQVFFLWQIIFGLIQLAAMAFCFWHFMPHWAEQPRFNFRHLRRAWRFTVGLGATGVMSFALSQMDKILLSKMLPLVLFAYYSVGNQMSIASRMLPAALYAAFFPRFTALIAQREAAQLRRLYHRATQLMSLVVFPASMVGAAFATQILRIWSGSPEIAVHAGPIASLLLIGSAFNSIAGVPYDVGVAYGLVRLGFYQTAISILILVPGMIIMVQAYGGIGAASLWLILNVGYMAIFAPIVHARVLPGESKSWYLVDIGAALFPAIAVPLLAKLLIPRNASELFMGGALVLTWLASTAVCALLLPEMRGYLLGRAKSFFAPRPI